MLEKMKQILRLGAVALVIAVMGVSCATIPVSQDQTRIEGLLAELNDAPIERLVELTARPFLLDGEIVILERDVEMMWSNLREVGFRFDDVSVESVGPVTENDYLEFGDTMDVRVWFERYTAENAGLARVRTTHGQFLIVTGETDEVGLQIFGFTGPRG